MKLAIILILQLTISFNSKRIKKSGLIILIFIFPVFIQAQEYIGPSYKSNEAYKDTIWRLVTDETAMCFDVNSNGRIYAGLFGRCGVMSSDDNGENWTTHEITENTSTFTHEIAITSKNVIYIISGDLKLYQSMDYGRSWTQLFPDLIEIEFWAIAINSKDVVFLGTDAHGLYTLSNNNKLLPTSYNGLNTHRTYQHIENIFVTNDDEIVIDSKYIYKSNDDGNSWERVDRGLEPKAINGLAVKSTGEYYAGGPGPGGALFWSNNKGAFWKYTGYRFLHSDSVVHTVMCNSLDEIFFSTYAAGVQMLGNDNRTIQRVGRFTNEKRQPSTYGLLPTPDGHVLAGTRIGTFKSEEILFPPDIDTINYSVLLEQNFPNPFSSKTTIRYTIPDETYVNLTIFNAEGKIVETLVSEIQQGPYSIQWTPGNKVNGIYFCFLKTKEFSPIIKMLRIDQVE